MTRNETIEFNRYWEAAILRISKALPVNIKIHRADDFLTGDKMVKWTKTFPGLLHSSEISFDNEKEMWKWVKQFIRLNVQDLTVTLKRLTVFDEPDIKLFLNKVKGLGMEWVERYPNIV